MALQSNAKRAEEGCAATATRMVSACFSRRDFHIFPCWREQPSIISPAISPRENIRLVIRRVRSRLKEPACSIELQGKTPIEPRPLHPDATRSTKSADET